MDVSVVLCVYNGADTLAGSLRAIAAQSFPRERYEVIVVDDGSTDDSARIAAEHGAQVLQQAHRGHVAAKNLGWRSARGTWIAFTDDDCGPTRHWLALLRQAVERGDDSGPALGAAGRIAGYPSPLAVPRYVELTGGFNTERHLQHPTFPFAPGGNAMYRREALAAVGGLDERYSSYDMCELHTRLRRTVGGAFHYEPRAVVFHHHYTDWRAFFRQQRGYGRGLAQFMLHHRDEAPWSAWRELRAWGTVAGHGLAALRRGTDDAALRRHGDFVRQLALRVGFAETYFNRRERGRW
ncbi:MAG: glycosyltransferase [Deltaproteobacteria bacterium]|nr:glycosyltransferase [Deltaproteobacteria bacterium]